MHGAQCHRISIQILPEAVQVSVSSVEGAIGETLTEATVGGALRW